MNRDAEVLSDLQNSRGAVAVCDSANPRWKAAHLADCCRRRHQSWSRLLGSWTSGQSPGITGEKDEHKPNSGSDNTNCQDGWTSMKFEYLDNFYWTISFIISCLHMGLRYWRCFTWMESNSQSLPVVLTSKNGILFQLISSYCITLRYLNCVIASGMSDSQTFFFV